MSMNTMGERIKHHRKRLGMTQEQLAERLRVSPQAVSKWENNLSCPDISLLPELADVLGISVDELLGRATVESKEPEKTFAFRWDGVGRSANWCRKWSGLLFPLFVMIFGGLWLVNVIFHIDVPWWTLLWTLSLMYFGVMGGRYMLIVGLTGLYYLLSAYDLIHLTVGWEIVVPVVVLAWGLNLLANMLWTRNKKKHRFVKGKRGESYREFGCEDGRLQCEMAFGSDRASVVTEQLREGHIETSFGQFTVDFSACESVAPNCRLEVENSFGSLLLLIPRRYRVHLADTENFFSGCSVEGSCDTAPVGEIFLNFENSFGNLVVQYID